MSTPTTSPAAPAGSGEAPAPDGAHDRRRELRFVRRVHGLRTLGLGLGFLCVASVFRLSGEPLWLWGLLAADAFVWPHVAWLLAERSPDPARAEFRHLTLDSALGGMWIALMQFNALPSALFATMLVADKIAVRGTRFALSNAAALLGACALTSAALGFAVRIETPMSVVVACIPLLIAYPLAISNVLYALAARVTQQNRRLAQLSSTDELTGLANRRVGLIAAEQALARHRRRGGSAVLIMVDVDLLKQINDRYGHVAGDRMLQAVGATLEDCSRMTDTAARYGGDEFLLVLPETDLHGATELTKRMREHLAATVFEQAPGAHCTVSLGAAEARADTADVADWIRQADAALYRAKAAGGDRLVNAPMADTASRRDHDRPAPGLPGVRA